MQQSSEVVFAYAHLYLIAKTTLQDRVDQTSYCFVTIISAIQDDSSSWKQKIKVSEVAYIPWHEYADVKHSTILLPKTRWWGLRRPSWYHWFSVISVQLQFSKASQSQSVDKLALISLARICSGEWNRQRVATLSIVDEATQQHVPHAEHI